MISATSSRVIISLSFSDKDRTTGSEFYDVADRLVTPQPRRCLRLRGEIIKKLFVYIHIIIYLSV